MGKPASADGVVEAVRALALAQPSRTVYVGIDGFGAAGKTTLARRLAAALGRVTVVHVDDFSGPGVVDWQWDWPRMQTQLLDPLAAGRSARYQRWCWDADVGGDWVDVLPGTVLVVEGVSSTRRELRVDWDLTVWVQAPRHVRLARARERDGEAMLPRWLEDWMPSEQGYAAAQRPAERADLIVDGAVDP